MYPVFVVILSSLLTSSCYADIDARAIAFMCSNCHGQTNTDIPSLAGKSATELQQKLLDYKAEQLPATIMPRIAKGYSDAELLSVANYLANN